MINVDVIDHSLSMLLAGSSGSSPDVCVNIDDEPDAPASCSTLLNIETQWPSKEVAWNGRPRAPPPCSLSLWRTGWGARGCSVSTFSELVTSFPSTSVSVSPCHRDTVTR